MAASNPIWSVQDTLYGCHDLWSRLDIACKGKRYRVEIFPENFIKSEASFNVYKRFLNGMDDDQNGESTSEDFYDWVVTPLLPILAEAEEAPPSNGQPFTLRDYLLPETCHYQLYFVNDKVEPRYDHGDGESLFVPGLDIGDFALPSTWGKYTPDMVQQCLGKNDYGYSKKPRKVSVDGKLCFLKEFHSRRGFLRELETYKKIEQRGLSRNEDVQVPQFVGVVYVSQDSRRVYGMLISLVDCENLTLSCALRDKVTFAQIKKWEEQIATTVELLHEAGIVWGDVKTNNVLIDKNDDAWVIDFGGGYTQGWVDKKHRETMKGDEEGLFKILERLYAGHRNGDEGDEAREEMAAMREG
ncbi:hypothetical protein ASPBRDRAFT_139214 [Aspergillus brasiliensis CBS 101740]|uniref:Protein kinase domain-containing protein n=1 Tax=Aspergillus brasiliensis (strain CBS 101740 / IMI 381727 / IBT 21946) TaxID=767769 RepID=A0A1L9U2N0_ASPBC|nr:hypothetical protein ASPBRDRAFT_139214 [Aspergillus brasiliensis CBS 101740]